jgi:hypothetical protein
MPTRKQTRRTDVRTWKNKIMKTKILQKNIPQPHCRIRRSVVGSVVMPNSLLLRIGRGCLLLGVFACTAFVAFGAPLPTADTQTLAGAWNTTIIFDDPSLPGCTTPGLDTSDGGIVTQGCDVSESPGYGQWRRIGPREFAVTFIGVVFGPAGTGITSTYKVRATVHMSQDGQTSSGPFLSEVFALDGTLLFSATGTVNRQRVAVEPLP